MEGLLNVILYPITSTQLGVFNNFLDMKKLDVLKAVDSRAELFKYHFLDIFVKDPEHKIKEIDDAKKARREAREEFDKLLKSKWNKNDVEDWERNWRKYEKLTNMKQKRYQLRELFSDKYAKTDPSFTELPSSILHQIMRKNPRFVAGISHSFNLLGAVGAIYSIYREAANPNSGLRQENKRDIAVVTATAIGGVGSVVGTVQATYDLAKVLKEKLFRPRNVHTTHFGVRSSEELATFEEELATEVGVDLNNMERYASRLERMERVSKLGKLFTVFGIAADSIFFVVSVYDLYKDFTADSVDPWKVADDFAFATSAGLGAAFGKCSQMKIVRPYFLY